MMKNFTNLSMCYLCLELDKTLPTYTEVKKRIATSLPLMINIGTRQVDGARSKILRLQRKFDEIKQLEMLIRGP